MIKDIITIDSKSGYSGAGKSLEKKFTHKNLYSSIYAYKTKNHRHIIEVDQQIKKKTKKKVKFSFNPHLLPTFRGILTSIYVDLKKGSNIKKLRNELLRFYRNKKFVKILELNAELGSGNVLNTNNCEISICNTRIKNKIVIFSAIDNLVKGASGQAIQNMNLLYKFSEQDHVHIANIGQHEQDINLMLNISASNDGKQLVFSKVLKKMWPLFNTIQLVLLIKFMAISIPANASGMFDKI